MAVRKLFEFENSIQDAKQNFNKEMVLEGITGTKYSDFWDLPNLRFVSEMITQQLHLLTEIPSAVEGSVVCSCGSRRVRMTMVQKRAVDEAETCVYECLEPHCKKTWHVG